MHSKTEGKVPGSRLNVWPASPGPGSNITRSEHGRGGLVLEVAACNRQRVEIQKDRNNQIRLHLRWNIHRDRGEGPARFATSVTKTLSKAQVPKRHKGSAVYSLNCSRTWGGNETIAG